MSRAHRATIQSLGRLGNGHRGGWNPQLFSQGDVHQVDCRAGVHQGSEGDNGIDLADVTEAYGDGETVGWSRGFPFYFVLLFLMCKVIYYLLLHQVLLLVA